MNVHNLISLALDPALFLSAQRLAPDSWQRDFLLSADRRVLLTCCRQWGKSTTTAALALHTALFRPGALVLLLSPTQRQSHELFRKVLDAFNAVARPVPPVRGAQTPSPPELANGARITRPPATDQHRPSLHTHPPLILP